MKCAHVIGAGLAGLSAAVRLAKAGVKVTVSEAAPHAGGRCRSFSDPALQAVIDNGRHLMLSGNVEALAYLDLIGAAGEVVTQPSARFDFFDVQSDARWTVDFGAGQGKLSLLNALMRKGSRPPGVKAATLMNDMRALKRAGAGTVQACVGASKAFEVFWRPLAVSVLNTPPEAASAQLLYRALEETVIKGGAFACPLMTRSGLGAALIDPALTTLARLDASVRLGARVKALDTDAGRVTEIVLANGAEVLGPRDAVVLAVPHFAVSDLLGGVDAPGESHAILNVHYRLPEGCNASRMAGPMIGLIGGQAEWVFVRGSIASVTVSAADAWMDKDGDAIAHDLWPQAARALGLGADMAVPTFRVIKERRATFAQTPAALTSRPDCQSNLENLFLAGDWVATDLPATIEGAVKSGRLAAQAVLAKWDVC